MTKETLLQGKYKAGACPCNAMVIPIEMLEKFLSKNVVIPKGENRHPYADVWHEYVEDTTKTLQHKTGSWYIIEIASDCEWRIKPSEPIYEWQWLYYSKIEGKAFLTPNFYNEHEAKKELQEGHTRIEETKRIRQ